MAHIIEFKIVVGRGECMFRTKTTTPMNSIINAFKESRGIHRSITLFSNSQEVTVYDTPHSLRMKDGDTLFAEISDQIIIDILITHCHMNGSIRAHEHTTISSVIDKFTEKYGLEKHPYMKLHFGTYTCNATDTVKDLGLTSGDKLELMQ